MRQTVALSGGIALYPALWWRCPFCDVGVWQNRRFAIEPLQVFGQPQLDALCNFRADIGDNCGTTQATTIGTILRTSDPFISLASQTRSNDDWMACATSSGICTSFSSCPNHSAISCSRKRSNTHGPLHCPMFCNCWIVTLDLLWIVTVAQYHNQRGTSEKLI